MTDKNLNNEANIDTARAEPNTSYKMESHDYIIDKPNFFIGLIDLVKSIFKL